MSQLDDAVRQLGVLWNRLTALSPAGAMMRKEAAAAKSQPPHPQAGGRGRGAAGGAASGGRGGGRGTGGGGGPQAAAAATPMAIWRQRQEDLERRARDRRHGAGSSSGDDGAAMQEQQLQLQYEWDAGLREYVKREFPAAHKQLAVPPGFSSSKQGFLWKLWLKGAHSRGPVEEWEQRKRAASAPGGWQKVGGTDAATKAQRKAAVEAAAARWGGAAPDARAAPEMLDDLFALSYALRHRLADAWREEARRDAAEELAGALERVERLQLERNELRNSAYEAVLSKVGLGGGGGGVSWRLGRLSHFESVPNKRAVVCAALWCTCFLRVYQPAAPPQTAGARHRLHHHRRRHAPGAAHGAQNRAGVRASTRRSARLLLRGCIHA
jgi:hypothetical protein